MKYRANYMLLSFMLITAGALNGAANKSLQERCAEIIASDPTVMPKSMHLLPQIMQLEISDNRSGPLTLFVNNALLKRIPPATTRLSISTEHQHEDDTTATTFSPDGKTVASASLDGTVKEWTVSDGTLKSIFTFAPNDDSTASVTLSPDGETLAAASLNNGTINVWNMADKTLKHSLPIGQRDTALSDNPIEENSIYYANLLFSPDSKTLASSGRSVMESQTFRSYDLPIQLWNVTDGTLRHPFPDTVGYLNAFNSDGKTVAIQSPVDNSITLWNVTDGTVQRTVPVDIYLVDSYLDVFCFSPDGKTLALGLSDGTIVLLDHTNGTRIHTIPAHTTHAYRAHSFLLAFSPDGKTLASAASTLSNDSGVKLWNVADGKRKHTFIEHAGDFDQLVFSPDGQTIALSRPETIALWRVDYQYDLRRLNIDRATQQLLYHAAIAWNNKQPLPVVACNPGYQTLIEKLPYLNDNRLFIVLSPEQADFLDKAIRHYNTRRPAELHRPYIIRTEADLKIFESLPDTLKNSRLFLRPTVIPPTMPASSDSASSSSTLQDDSATPPRDAKRTGREEEVEDVSNKRQR